MLELIVNKDKNVETIILSENGKMVEHYVNDEQSEKTKQEGNIYIGQVEDIVNGMQAAFVDFGEDKKGFIHVKDAIPQVDETKEIVNRNVDIKQTLKLKQKILIQVKKDGNDTKGARVSTHISLPGKYIVLMPDTNFIPVSQKIQNESERKKLIEIIKSYLPDGFGAVIRTSAEKVTEKEIKEDIDRLVALWKNIKEGFEKNQKKIGLLWKSEGIIERIVTDLSSKNLKKIIVNNEEDYNKLKKMYESENIDIVLEKAADLINKYDFEKQIEKIKNRKVWLNCGGFITIDKTEALTAIDVNTGKFTGNNNLETTIFKVNKEATLEIAKQLRLRDIGGIIIIDYIDMHNEENKTKIENLLKEALKEDRSKTQVEGFTRLNLMELTRKHICSHLNNLN